MKLNKEVIKSVINYVIENQKFDFEKGQIEPIYLSTIVDALSNGNEDKMQEVACAIVRCINEGLLISNYSRIVKWSESEIIDVTFRGFRWLEDN